MTTLPSASMLESSTEAFKHPLPIVKQLHKQLEQALEEKNARLRTLVGGSYRQLLGTAETIIDMRHDITTVEHNLEHVVDGCGRDIIARKSAALSGLRSIESAEAHAVGNKDSLAFLARVKLLDGCVLAISRLIRSHEIRHVDQKRHYGRRLLSAAKLLVLSRLLLKNNEVTLNRDRDTWFTEAKRKVTRLRRRLLRGVERSFESSIGDIDDLSNLMCAYSLATSSSARDVARYYLHVRGEAIATSLEVIEGHDHKSTDSDKITSALYSYTQTLLDFQSLIPSRLAKTLKNLKTGALLQDPDVKDQESLRLDMAESWLDQGLSTFVPYIQHDDINSSQAREMLSSWSSRALQILLKGFERAFSLITDFAELMILRNTVFEIWIKEGSRANGYDSASFLDQLRGVINERLSLLVDTRVQRLHLLSSEVEAILATWPPEHVSNTLWINDLSGAESAASGMQLKNSVIDHVNGRDNATNRVVHSYETWYHFIDDMLNAFAELRNRRWIDDLEDLEDESSLDERQTLLSIDDPAKLQVRLEQSLSQSFRQLHDTLSGYSGIYLQTENKGAISAFILRIIREIRSRLPTRPDLQFFGLSLTPELHKVFVTSIVARPLSRFTRTLLRTWNTTSTILWEGSPLLPLQPSPSLFRLLYDIALAMSHAGSDLWTKTAVSILKDHLCQRILRTMDKHIVSIPPEESTSEVTDHTNDGSAEKETSGLPTESSLPSDSDQSSNMAPAFATQQIFDMLVLQQVLAVSKTCKALTDIEARLGTYKPYANLADAHIVRIQNAASEYWKRTSLLFGSLA